jgi:hypothetical protein
MSKYYLIYHNISADIYDYVITEDYLLRKQHQVHAVIQVPSL